jgi:hypothetical protein
MREMTNDQFPMTNPAFDDGGIVAVPRAQIPVPMLAEIEALEGELLNLPQAATPVTHHFAPGVYVREIFMPAGTFVIGHCHRTEHLNVILAGRVAVMMDGLVHHLAAPCVLPSGAGVRKLLYIEEDCRWATIHPTEETNLEVLEEMLIVKSDTFLAHQLHAAELNRLREHAAKQHTEEPTKCPG